MEVFLYTALLSQNKLVGLSIGTPIMHNVYCKAVIDSTAFFLAVDSDTNVEVSTPFCIFAFQMIGAQLQNIKIQFIILLVTLSPA